jgi:hypothetical protein
VWPSGLGRVEFDSDFGGHLFQSPPDFLSGVRQPVRVNVDSNVAARAPHMSALLETRDRLLELMPALRALESDEVCVAHETAQCGAKSISHLSGVHPLFIEATSAA